MEYPVIRTPPHGKYIPPLVCIRHTPTTILLRRDRPNHQISLITRGHKPHIRAADTIRDLPITWGFTLRTAHPAIQPLAPPPVSTRPTATPPRQATPVDILQVPDIPAVTLPPVDIPPQPDIRQVTQHRVVTILNKDIVTLRLQVNRDNPVIPRIQVVTHLPTPDIPAQLPDIRVVLLLTIQVLILVIQTVHLGIPVLLLIREVHIRLPPDPALRILTLLIQQPVVNYPVRPAQVLQPDQPALYQLIRVTEIHPIGIY